MLGSGLEHKGRESKAMTAGSICQDLPNRILGYDVNLSLNTSQEIISPPYRKVHLYEDDM